MLLLLHRLPFATFPGYCTPRGRGCLRVPKLLGTRQVLWLRAASGAVGGWEGGSGAVRMDSGVPLCPQPGVRLMGRLEMASEVGLDPQAWM